jgi:fucose 4-O-acetylase-like acetyltransferase
MRDPFLDNSKFVLIAMVVFGHLLEPILDRSLLAHTIYLLIYSFHIPAFVFLAGVTTNSNKWGCRDGSLLWTLVLFQCLYVLVARVNHLQYLYSFPYWLMWFLLSLLYWRLAAAVLIYRKLPHWVILSSSVVLCAVAGYFHLGRTLSMMRTLVFCPFFFLGLLYGKEVVAFVRRRSVLVTTLSCAVFAAAFFAAAHSGIDLEWLYGGTRYSAMGRAMLSAWAIRLSLLAIGMILTMAFLKLVPARKLWFTDRGKSSLEVYLLHGLFVLCLRNLLAQSPIYEAWGIIAICTVGLVFLCSSEIVRKYLSPALDISSLLKRRENPLMNSFPAHRQPFIISSSGPP